MIQIQPDTVIVRAQALTAKVDDDLVFFNANAGKYFATGTVGAEIWELIASPRSVSEICAALLEKFDVAEEICLNEVQEFVKALVDAELAECR